MLNASAGDFITDKVADLSYTIAKQAGTFLDNILSIN